MPLLDQGFDPTDPANAAIIARLAATMGVGGSPDAGGFDARSAGMFGPGNGASSINGLGILNGGGFPAVPAAAPGIPLPPPRPADPAANFGERSGAMFDAPGAVPLPTPRPALAPGAPGLDAFASAPAAAVPASAPAAAAAPPVPESSLLGRFKESLSRFGDSINAHPMTLMALGAGLAGAPSWGSGISRGLAGAGPASRLDMQTQLQQGGIQAAYSALQDHFVRQGDNAAVAGRKALSLVYNPEWMKTVGPQIFGPTTPSTVNYKDVNGIERTAVYDPREQVLKDIQTGAPVGPRLGNAPGPLGVSGAAPSAPAAGGGTSTGGGAAAGVGPSAPAAAAGLSDTLASGTLAPAIMSQPQGSQVLAAPPPGTANIPAWTEGQLTAANAASAKARTRAQGGQDTIQKLTELEGLVRDAPEDAFGTFAGSDEGYLSGKTFNRFSAALGLPSYSGGAPAKELIAAHERLKGAYAGAIEPLARAISGGDATTSGGRMNTAILDQAKAIIGGTETSDKATALQQLQDAKVRAWDGIQEGLREHVFDPARLPRASAEQGIAMGRGAIWVDPAGNIRRNKL